MGDNIKFQKLLEDGSLQRTINDDDDSVIINDDLSTKKSKLKCIIIASTVMTVVVGASIATGVFFLNYRRCKETEGNTEKLCDVTYTHAVNAEDKLCEFESPDALCMVDCSYEDPKTSK